MIAIVGATGYIGRYLCPYLKQKGFEVLALGRSKKVQEFMKEHDIPFQYFDITDSESFRCLESYPIDAIVDLSACLAEHETPVEDFFSINTIGVYHLLEYCRNHNIERFILTSSHKVYNDVNKEVIDEATPISFKGDHSAYIISKIAAENFVEYYRKDFGIKGIVLRLSGVHGYGEVLGHLDVDGTYKKSTFEIFFEKALDAEPIEIWGDQSIKRDHVYIKDVLSAIECSILAPKDTCGVFNVASGIGYSQYEEALALAKVFAPHNKQSQIILCPEKPGLKRGYVYSIEKARKELGYNPKYSDIETMMMDYKKEWNSKEYHHYHYIKESDAPKTI